jgi:hypothetical protein
MSNRERWIVYPLIFFAFLMGARDKFLPPEHVSCEDVVCNRLTVVGSEGKPAVRIRATEDDAGLITVSACRLDPDLPGTPPADIDQPRRALGYEAIELSANRDGGFVRVIGTRVGTDLYVGHNRDAQVSGYVAVDEQGEFLRPSGADQLPQIWGLTRPWTPEDNRGERRKPRRNSVQTGVSEFPRPVRIATVPRGVASNKARADGPLARP